MGVTHFPNGVNIGSNAGGTADFQLGGTTVTATAAELNYTDGAAGYLAAGTAAGIKIAGGIQSVTTAATITTNLTTVTSVTATLTTAGTTAGTAAVVTAGTAGGGSIYLRTWAGPSFETAGTVAQSVNWVAVGT